MMFDPFDDFETAGYLRNVFKLKDPAQIKKMEHLAFESSLEDAISLLSSCRHITYQTLLELHHLLFADFYPWAGKDRAELAPRLAVFKGTDSDPRHTVFCPPDQIRHWTSHALILGQDQQRLKQHPGEVLGLLADAHPFLDGNGRTILLVFMELCHRAGFAIDWSRTTKDDYLAALSTEINQPSKGHLDQYLKPFLVKLSNRKQWPDVLGAINGLDGLDKENIRHESLDDPGVQALYRGYRSLPPCSTLILAGGRGQRMGGRDKGLIEWKGEPLVAHVQRVVRPLSDDLVISCNRNQEAYRAYADQLVGDAEADFPGPLAGVIAGLKVARYEWVVLLACDAPLVDRVLIEDLLRLAVANDSAAMVRQGGYWQPMFSVLPRRVLPRLEQAWAQGERSLQRALLRESVQGLECTENDSRLSNFNSPELLKG
ncbi:molybdenum cofactor guanylyltransferase MobA [Pseudomonas monteilii]|nr:molybdenum cofactor guanylyltransferase MobA [Pseudomonas monteilii]AYN99972.1 molybdenum cofactor guanylyltransferase MobA [Pseudomonas sp. LTGT-11-2Z]MBA1318995.1 molybdenum cofactor guanylyltransferase MobA [Pseudomonas monteilii]